MIDSTDFRTGGNENAASIIQSVGVGLPDMSNKIRREARDVRERRDVDRLGPHLLRRFSLVPPVSRGYPAVGCSKRPSSKAAADESTGGVASGLR